MSRGPTLGCSMRSTWTSPEAAIRHRCDAVCSRDGDCMTTRQNRAQCSSGGWSARRTRSSRRCYEGSWGRFRSLSKGRDPERELRVALESHLPGITRAFADPSSEATLPREAEAWARQLVHDGVSLTAALRSFRARPRGRLGHHRVDPQGEPLGPVARAPRRRNGVCIRPPLRLRERDHGASHIGLHRRAGKAGTTRRVKPRARRHRPFARATSTREWRSGRSRTAWTRFTSGTPCGTPAGPTEGTSEALASELGRRIAPWQHLSVRSDSGTLNGWMSCDANALHRGLHGLLPPLGVEASFGSPRWGLIGISPHAPRGTRSETRWPRDRWQAVTTYDDVGVLGARVSGYRAGASFRGGDTLARSAQMTRSNKRLRETLRVYLQERGSPAATAARLRLHRNTVVKRIQKVEELLETPIDRGSLNVRVALELARVFPR
jgi:hypothetical protein